jgi:hypothetical protein
VRLALSWPQLRRLFPVVVAGRVTLLFLAEALLLLLLLVVALAGGPTASQTVKMTVIFPAMLAIALTSADLVAGLRASGDLELVVTLGVPIQALLHRFLPLLAVVVVQVVVVASALALFLPPGQIAIGAFETLLPVLLALAATLYWNLRLRGPGAVLLTTLVTLLPFLIWIGRSELFFENTNMLSMSRIEVVVSALRCQLGMLLATACLGALAWRRLDHLEEILHE